MTTQADIKLVIDQLNNLEVVHDYDENVTDDAAQMLAALGNQIAAQAAEITKLREYFQARAIEQAVMAKLLEQNEPFAWACWSDGDTEQKPIDCYLSTDEPTAYPIRKKLFTNPAPSAPEWISVEDRLPDIGRTPILVAVSWIKYGENEDGTPTEATGIDITEGEYVPAHGEAGGYFDSYQGNHGDRQYITHWMPLPKPPMAAAAMSEERGMILTIAEIYDLACCAGFTINHSPAFMPDTDEMETEITIDDCPVIGLLDDDNVSRRHYSKIAYFTEYPEEGSFGLGKELAAARSE